MEKILIGIRRHVRFFVMFIYEYLYLEAPAWTRKPIKATTGSPEKAFYDKGVCPACGDHNFELGPDTGGILINIRCQKCNTYYGVVPETRHIQPIDPDYKW